MTSQEKKALIEELSKKVSVNLSEDNSFAKELAPNVEGIIQATMDTQIKDAVATHLAKTGFDVAGLRFNWGTVVSLVSTCLIAGALWGGLRSELKNTQKEIVAARQSSGLNKKDIQQLDDSISRLETTIAVLVDREERSIQMLRRPNAIAPQDNTGRNNR